MCLDLFHADGGDGDSFLHVSAGVVMDVFQLRPGFFLVVNISLDDSHAACLHMDS